MMFAAAALAVCTGTAYGQVLDVAPVGDAVMPDGRRVYAMPQTTVVVDITVARESVVTGPYARFAQKYFGVIAPLADKETYTLRSAAVSRYDPVVTRDLNPGPIPAPHTEIYADTGSAESSRGYFPTAAAPPAAAWRMRRGMPPKRYSTCVAGGRSSLRAIMPRRSMGPGSPRRWNG